MGQQVGAGDTLAAIARHVNDHPSYVLEQVFPWVGDVALLLFPPGVIPR